jgi:hypothetical protein
MLFGSPDESNIPFSCHTMCTRYIDTPTTILDTMYGVLSVKTTYNDCGLGQVVSASHNIAL